MDIEELAVKCGIKPVCYIRKQSLLEYQKVYAAFDSEPEAENGHRAVALYTKDQFEVLADEWLALNSTEPFGYWHTGETEEESDFFIAEHSGDVSCPDCIKLYKANPINQALLESHKRLEETLKFYADKSSWYLDNVTSGDISRRIVLYKDQYGVNEWTTYAGKKAVEALASIPVLLEELKCATV